MNNIKKQIPTGLVILMVIAMIGIIAIQFFWFLNAMNVKEARFDQAVNEALTDVSRKMNKERHAYFISDQIKSPKVIFSSDDSDLDVVSDSVEWKYSFHSDNDSDRVTYTFGSDNNFRTIIFDNDSNDQSILLNSFFGDTDQYSVLIKLDSLKNTLEKKHKHIQEVQDSLEINITNQIITSNRNTEDVDRTIDEMMIELKTMNVPFRQQFSEEDVKEKIKSALKDHAIELPFTFEIISHSGDSLNSFQEVEDTRQNHVYQIRLFPDNMFVKSDMLLLALPDKSSYLMKSMSLLLAGSALFTLIIIFTFFITLRIIFRQKKLASIKSDFINNMTHEFKTPIATISLAVDSIKNPAVINNPEKINYFTDVIRDENKRMNANVENVLQMALIDKGDFNFNPGDVDIHKTIHKAAENVKLLLNQKKGTISFSLNASNHILYLDESHFRNIISNLLDNAIKYSTTAPDIQIRTFNTSESFIVEVTDNGLGISKEFQDKIFEKFYRVSKGDIHNIKGFGLGLSYVKALVLAWGGDISIKSHPGQGSTFSIYLPLNQAT